VKPADERAMQRILDLGWATREQVEEAIETRRRVSELGMRPPSVHELLYERGHLEEEQLEHLRREERRFEGREQIAGYRLLERLGEGAMGSVYKARQLSLDRDVAIKVLSPALSQDEAYVERFLREAKAVARLNHTNIISGIDVGDAGGIKYLVMEYADGTTVAALLRRGGAMDEERALLIAQQMARALDHAHRAGLVHRDVKPDNVIVTREGVAKLCDLGLARLDTAGGEIRARMGTPAYISPEQARGDPDVDARADLYSLGASLFHMLTGREPFEGASASAVLARHLTEPPPSVRTILPEVAPATDALVQRLMAKDPGERFQSAAEVLGALEPLVKELQAARGAAAQVGAAAAPAPAAGPPGAPPLRRRRRR
jgi:serine/threonine protein kinase